MRYECADGVGTLALLLHDTPRRCRLLGALSAARPLTLDCISGARFVLVAISSTVQSTVISRPGVPVDKHSTKPCVMIASSMISHGSLPVVRLCDAIDFLCCGKCVTGGGSRTRTWDEQARFPPYLCHKLLAMDVAINGNRLGYGDSEASKNEGNWKTHTPTMNPIQPSFLQ